MKRKINVMWFKRDFRLSDHAPLKRAIDAGLPLSLIAIVEPEAETFGELGGRHRRFVADSVAEMNAKLSRFGARVEMFAGSAEDVFGSLFDAFDVSCVFSHRETGIGWTFDRDRRLGRMFRERGVRWCESDFSGVERGLRDRDGWAERWNAYVESPNENPDLAALKTIPLPNTLPSGFHYSPPASSEQFQRGGTSVANSLIDAFVARGGRDFLAGISSPTKSVATCSRLSPYLAWGNVSVRQVWRLTSAHVAGNRDIAAFRSRLAWRDHFIQRFEMASSIETEPINRHAAELGREPDAHLLELWKEGRTGFPLIDAAMRCVKATGWLNFRLRATVVSFLTHLMWLDWREAAVYLGRQFVDYEPGIHYCQFMMQSGESGFHTIRVYNPVKQSREHDPDGAFIRRWIPEIAMLSDEQIHEPWRVGELEAKMLGLKYGDVYPRPVVDLETASKRAAARLWEWKSRDYVATEAEKLAAKHRG